MIYATYKSYLLVYINLGDQYYFRPDNCSKYSRFLPNQYYYDLHDRQRRIVISL